MGGPRSVVGFKAWKALQGLHIEAYTLHNYGEASVALTAFIRTRSAIVGYNPCTADKLYTAQQIA
jgi:hypothetical protein